MKDLLKEFVGKRVDVHCSGSTVFRGSVKKADDGIVQLVDDEDRVFYIDGSRIIAVSEVTDASSRPGFLAK